MPEQEADPVAAAANAWFEPNTWPTTLAEAEGETRERNRPISAESVILDAALFRVATGESML